MRSKVRPTGCLKATKVQFFCTVPARFQPYWRKDQLMTWVSFSPSVPPWTTVTMSSSPGPGSMKRPSTLEEPGSAPSPVSPGFQRFSVAEAVAPEPPVEPAGEPAVEPPPPAVEPPEVPVPEVPVEGVPRGTFRMSSRPDWGS